MKHLILVILSFVTISCTSKESNPTNNNPNNEEPFWEMTAPLGKRIDVLYVDSNDNILVATANGYLYRSSDNGNNWNLINEELTNRITHIYSVVVNSHGHIFITTGQIYRSTDIGQTWTEVSNNKIRSDYLLMDNDDIIYGISCCGWGCSGVYRSTDNGETWIIPSIIDPNFTPSIIVMNSKKQIYATDEEALYKSTDLGLTWSKIRDGYNYSIAVNKNDVIYLIEGNALWKSLFKSIDDGFSWEKIKDVSITELLINNKNYFYGINSTNGLLCSYDEGITWKEINKGLGVLHVRDIVINSEGFLFAGTADYDNYNNLNKGEVYRSIKSTTN